MRSIPLVSAELFALKCDIFAKKNWKRVYFLNNDELLHEFLSQQNLDLNVDLKSYNSKRFLKLILEIHYF